MQSADTNIFIHFHDVRSPWHDKAKLYMTAMSQERAFCISSYMLVELYNQLRNQALFQKPYSAQKAAATCLHYKNNANWGYVDYEPDVDGDLWRFAANPDFARRKIYDARMAITLRRYGVAEFATTNIKDFEGFGFQKLWNPLKD